MRSCRGSEALWVFKQQSTNLCLWRRIPGWGWRGAQFDLVVEDDVGDQVKGVVALHDRWLVLATASGAVLALDPLPFETAAFAREVTDDKKAPFPPLRGAVLLLDGIDEPRGLVAILPDELVLWTERELHLLRFEHRGEDAPALVKRRTLTEAEDITGVKALPDGRIVVAFQNHFSIRGQDLRERFRLYLIDDHPLIRVPMARTATDATRDLFWYDGGLDALPEGVLRVVDARGETVAGPRARSFLAQFFSKEAVARVVSGDDKGLDAVVGSARALMAGPRGTLALHGVTP